MKKDDQLMNVTTTKSCREDVKRLNEKNCKHAHGTHYYKYSICR